MFIRWTLLIPINPWLKLVVFYLFILNSPWCRRMYCWEWRVLCCVLQWRFYVCVFQSDTFDFDLCHHTILSGTISELNISSNLPSLYIEHWIAQVGKVLAQTSLTSKHFPPSIRKFLQNAFIFFTSYGLVFFFKYIKWPCLKSAQVSASISR